MGEMRDRSTTLASARAALSIRMRLAIPYSAVARRSSSRACVTLSVRGLTGPLRAGAAAAAGREIGVDDAEDPHDDHEHFEGDEHVGVQRDHLGDGVAEHLR